MTSMEVGGRDGNNGENGGNMEENVKDRRRSNTRFSLNI
jgi:hypothetical protein